MILCIYLGWYFVNTVWIPIWIFFFLHFGPLAWNFRSAFLLNSRSFSINTKAAIEKTIYDFNVRVKCFEEQKNSFFACSLSLFFSFFLVLKLWLLFEFWLFFEVFEFWFIIGCQMNYKHLRVFMPCNWMCVYV